MRSRKKALTNSEIKSKGIRIEMTPKAHHTAKSPKVMTKVHQVFKANRKPNSTKKIKSKLMVRRSHQPFRSEIVRKNSRRI